MTDTLTLTKYTAVVKLRRKDDKSMKARRVIDVEAHDADEAREKAAELAPTGGYVSYEVVHPVEVELQSW